MQSPSDLLDVTAPAGTERSFTAQRLAELLDEFRMPGQPLHGLDAADAERIFVEVVEQLVLRAIERRRALRVVN